MAKLIATRGQQYPLAAEFTFNTADTMVNASGTLATFAVAQANVFDIFNFPVGAILTGGEVVTETAVTGSTAYNIKFGDATTDNRYLGTTDRVAAGRTALVPTGYVSDGGNLRLTVTPTVADATAGKVTVRIMYVIRNRVNETQTH